MNHTTEPHRILAKISSYFIGDSILENGIRKSFQELGEMAEADRIYLYRIHHKAKLAHITHEWLNPLKKKISGSTTSFVLQDFNWLISELRSKEIIQIKDSKKLPSVASNEIKALNAQNVKCFIIFPFKVKGKLEGLIGIDFLNHNRELTDDITEILKIATDIIFFSLERKLSEKSLRKSEKLYQGIFENTGAATSIIRADTGITMVNSEFEKLTGYSRRYVEGKMRLIDIVKDEYKTILKRYHHLLISNPAAIPENYEFEYLTKKGEVKTAYMTGSSLLDTNNCVISFIDITELKETENQLIIAKEKAEESDRLKSAFLSNVSHEIRTPLNAITGFAALLSNPNLHLDKKEKYIEQILNGSNELVSLIDNVLDISRIESGTLNLEISDYSLNSKLRETLDFYNDYKIQHAKDKINIKLKTPKNSQGINVKTDKRRLQQILANLFENAVKFTSSGTITFGYSILQDSENGSGQQNILFFVKDSGIGIAKKNKEMIFERFVKIVDKDDYLYRGAGLGLALTRDLVNLLGGKIWVESSLGAGSTFSFTLPFHEADRNPNINKIASEKDPDDWSDKTILVAEDIESNYIYIEEILGPTSAKLIRAKDGLEAIELFRKNKEEIDLVFMDILMPEYDGYEATKEIRKIKKNIPVVAQTAFTFEGEIMDGLYAGCFNDYILKPFNIKSMMELLAKYLLK